MYKEHSHFIHQRLKRLKLQDLVRLEELRSTISEVELVRLLRSKKLEAKENNLAYTSMYISKLGCLRMPFFSVKSLGTMESLD